MPCRQVVPRQWLHCTALQQVWLLQPALATSATKKLCFVLTELVGPGSQYYCLSVLF